MNVLLILLLFFSTPVFAQQCNNVQVVTGYGYLTNQQGQVTAYTNYPIGQVCIPNGLSYTEVANQSALSQVQIYVPPLTMAQQQQILIQQDEQALAVADLQNNGLLDSTTATSITGGLSVLNTAKKLGT